MFNHLERRVIRRVQRSTRRGEKARNANQRGYTRGIDTLVSTNEHLPK